MGNKIKLTLNDHSPINNYPIPLRGFPHFSLRYVTVSCLTLHNFHQILKGQATGSPRTITSSSATIASPPKH